MAQSSDFPWSRFGIPPEIALEIAAHNADDVTSLRAMSLVSRSMRSLAIEHLFSVVHFACAQDLSWWQTMLCRTPELATFVKKVKFSDASEDWIKRHRKVRYPQSLYVACLEPKFTAMPNVCAVEWDTCSINIWMAVAYMALFPNLKELHLRGINLHGFHELRQFLHACGRLQVLSFSNTIVAKNEWDEELPDPQWTNPDDDNSTTEDWVDDGSKLENRQQVSFPSDLKGWLHWFCEGPTRPVVPPLPLTFDLTALEELAVMDCGDQEHGYFGRLVEKSQPTGLRSLTFAGNCRGHDSCPIPDAEKLLRLATKTLVSLTVDPTFIVDSENLEFRAMFSRLPEFGALKVFSISLSDSRQAEQVLNALAAPDLTTLIFRMILSNEDEEEDREYFENILTNVFPWGGSETMKSALTRKFPRIRRIGFHFCISCCSTIHFRRVIRRRMERRLMERLEDTEADVAQYLELRWFDSDNNPVLYKETNGKPHWRFYPPSQEPETETSDCESEEESDGSASDECDGSDSD